MTAARPGIAEELLAVSAQLAVAVDADDLADVLFGRALPPLEVNGAALATERSDGTVEVVLSGPYGDWARHVLPREAGSPLLETLRDGQPRRETGRQALLRRWRLLERLLLPGTEQVLCRPLLVPGRRVGAVGVQLSGTAPLRPEQEAYLEGLLALVAQTAHRVQVTGQRRQEERAELDLQRAAAEITGASTEAEVLDAITSTLFPASSADGLLLSLVRGDRLQLVRAEGYPRPLLEAVRDLALDAATPLAGTAARGQPYFLGSRGEYLEVFPGHEELVALSGKHAWAFLPLRAGGRSVGTCLLSWGDERAFGRTERTRLLTLSGVVSQALERARLHDAERAVSLALQRAITPPPPPRLPALETAARYLPGGPLLQVGGDWYDVLPRRGLPPAVVIGDVVGHDVEAAGVMGGVRHAVRAYSAEGHEPALVLERVNGLLADADVHPERLAPQLATCLYLELDEDSGTAVVVTAGHPPPVLLRPGCAPRVLELDPGPPLGAQDDARFRESLVLLEPEDTLLLFTDGLVESPARPLGEGLAQLERAAGVAEGLPLERLVDVVLDAMGHGAESGDDVALVAVRYRPASGSRPDRWVRRRLPDEAHAASAARRSVVDVLRAWDLLEHADTATLLVSELVTNAVLHTLGGVSLEVSCTGDRLRVAVHDTSERRPRVRAAEDDGEATGGRGMVLVQALSAAWGTDESASGKCVWVELDLTS